MNKEKLRIKLKQVNHKMSSSELAEYLAIKSSGSRTFKNKKVYSRKQKHRKKW